MPRKPKKPCTRAGCDQLTDSGPCAEHKRQANKQRGTAAQRGYGQAHREEFRDAVLAKHPTCVLCRTAPSTVADHHPIGRKDLVAQGLNPNDPRHGRGLCASCHGRETQTNPGQRGGWNAR